jgi:hypothetical protein
MFSIAAPSQDLDGHRMPKNIRIFSVKMRSHDFVFLTILTIRVAFEANSMDPR